MMNRPTNRAFQETRPFFADFGEQRIAALGPSGERVKPEVCDKQRY